ncbi:MAG: hypothetical protein LBG65_00650 [Puniceicoccales bacterium]|jgi:hypothetical protein|nr:hypothetical protein [Puniceicoccales bacterium]
MKNPARRAITAITSATFVASLALAPAIARGQTFRQVMNNISVGARTGVESEYVHRGKEHSDMNLQTTATAQFNIPWFTASYGIGVFGRAFSMNPITQSANLLDTALGARLDYAGFGFEAGWIYHSFPNQRDQHYPIRGGDPNPVVNRPLHNRSHEFYVCAHAGLEALSPSAASFFTYTGSFLYSEGGPRFEAYAYYDTDLHQITTEADAAYTFRLRSLPLSLTLKGYAGYVRAETVNGNQRAAGIPRWRNDYAYAGAAADLAINIGQYTTFGAGIRYAWNNDGGESNDYRLAGNTASNLWWGAWLQFSF